MCKYFSLNSEETPHLSDISHLVICIRTIQNDFSSEEDMFDLIPFHSTTRGTNIFEAVDTVFSGYGYMINVLVMSLMEIEIYQKLTLDLQYSTVFHTVFGWTYTWIEE